MTNPSVPKRDRSALLGILAQQSDDVLAELMGKVAQAAIDAQFDEFIGAEHYERSADRKDRRNGFRERTVDTRMGSEVESGAIHELSWSACGATLVV